LDDYTDISAISLVVDLANGGISGVGTNECLSDGIQAMKKLPEWFLERCRKSADDVAAHQELLKARFAQRPDVTEGDIFLFKGMPEGCFLSFAVIRVHPEKPDLFFLAPCDDITTFVGVCDVFEKSDRASSPGIVARCGWCFWLTKEHFDLDLRIDIMSDEQCKACRQKVASMARGQLSYTEEQDATENDPSYEELLDTIQGWVTVLTERLRGF
jgi:hypothetical protein